MAQQDTATANRAPRSSSITTVLLVLLVACCIISLGVNLMHGETFQHHDPNMALATHLNSFKQGRPNKPETIDKAEEAHHHNPHNQHEEPVAHEHDKVQEKTESPPKKDADASPSKLAGLSCEAYGGPSPKAAEEMVYWHDIPSDQHYVSPLHAKRGGRRQYMTFEPDGGGWNNIRMAMETVVGLALAMGRTLVLPPAQGMYLLGKRDKNQRKHFSFAHFFPMLEMAEENDGLEIITMKEYLETEAMQGNLIDKNTGLPSFPPNNRTDWDGDNVKQLKEWLRNVTYIEHMWRPEQCMAAFPASGEHKDVEALQTMQKGLYKDEVKNPGTANQYIDHPVDVDADPLSRMRENVAQRSNLCVYDEKMQSQLTIHFMCYHKMRIRYLVHFYAFLFFEDWREDLWVKRFMRDHMRYIDEIQCAAARIVEAVRERSRKRQPQHNGGFDTFHIRRGDFQFKNTRIPANQIYDNVHDVMAENKTVYIATDERDKKFFDSLKEHYDVVFLDDFMHLLKGVNTNYFGMIDQLVAAKGDVFAGCWFSTFTGFINRIRGYYSTKYKLDGHEKGVLPTTYYYATKPKKLEMAKYIPLRGGFFAREFPTSWRQIDKSVGAMPAYN